MTRNRLRHLSTWLLIAVLSLAGVSAQTPQQIPLEFDGNASLSYPADPLFELGPEGTIDFWVKAGWTEALEQDACIVANSDKNSSRYAAYISGDGQGVVLWDGAASAGVDFNFLDGEAHHVALVTRGRETRFFVDGALLGTKPIGYGAARGLPFHVGTSDGGAEGFIGALQSLRLWSAALSDAQIVEIGALAGEPPASSVLAPLLRVVSEFTDTAQELVLLDPPAPVAPVRATLAVAPSPAQPAAPAPPPPPVDPGIQMWHMKTAADRWRQPPGATASFGELRQGAIDLWVQFDPTWQAGDDPHGTLVAYSNGYETVFEVGVTAGGDGIVMSNGKRDDYGQVSEQANIVSANLDDGNIHHLALVSQGDSTEVFVDGKSLGVASVGYAVAEDAAGPKTNLQISIGSLDGRKRAFQGRVGAVRLWGAPLPGEALFRAAYLRDNELSSIPWANAFLIAQLENQAGRTTKPALRFPPPLHLPAGLWMIPTDAQPRLANPGRTLENLDWTFRPQRYVQLVVTAPDSDLARYAGSGGAGPAARGASPVEATAPPRAQPTAVSAPPGFRMTANAGVGGQPAQLLTDIDLQTCAQQCQGVGTFVCASFDYVPAVRRCELNTGTEPLRQGVSGSYSFVATGAPATVASPGAATAAAVSLTPARPAESAATAEVPVLVWLEFKPYQSVTQPETLSAKLYQPVARNQYRASDGSTLSLSSNVYLTAGAETLQRFDIPDRPPKAGQPRVDDPFMVGQQVRGLASAQHGWDPIQLNPFDFAQPAGGQKADIFTYSPYGYRNKALKVVPKGFDIVDLQSGEGRRAHDEVTTERQLQEALGVMVSVGGGIESVKAAGSFTANAAFNAKTEKLKSGTSAYTLGQAIIHRVALVLDKPNIRLTEPFRQAVIAAAKDGNPADARRLIEQFGTHYAGAMVLGGRVIEMVEVDSETWGLVASHGLEVGAAMELRVGIKEVGNASGSLAGSMDTATEERVKSTVEKSKGSWSTSGGTGGIATSNWQVADDSIVPIFLDLRPISELLAPPFFLDPAVFDRLRPLVREAMREHVQRTAGPIQVDSKFVPRTFAKYVPPVEKKDCGINESLYRGAFSTDDNSDDGGGVWVQFTLPTAGHLGRHEVEGGCWSGDHWDGKGGAWVGLYECNTVCWSSATFVCNDGEWTNPTNVKMTSNIGCTNSGAFEQQGKGLLKGRGVHPWWKDEQCANPALPAALKTALGCPG